MNFLPHQLYHIYNQGNNGQVIFRDDEDFLTFLRLARSHILVHTDIIAWCLMSNHFHFLVFTGKKSCIIIKQGGINIEVLTNGIRKLLSSYARIFNKRYCQTGSVFRQKTKANVVGPGEMILQNIYTTQDYCSNCFRYIHQNPVMAGMVAHASQWPYSSYTDYAGLRKGNLCNKTLAAFYCGFNVTDFEADAVREIPEDFKEAFCKF